MLEEGNVPRVPGQEAPERDPAGPSTPAAAPFLDRIEEEERVALLASAHLDQYPAGTVICHEGDAPDALYIVHSGRVAVLKEVQDGHPVLLGYRGPGEILGEMSLVAQQPRSATLVAMDDTALLHIAAPDFPHLTAAYPGIYRAMLSILSDRLQEADVARTTVVQEERGLAQRLEMVTGEAERLAEMARVHKETLELVVHDLRTPLTVINGCLDMLRHSLPHDTPPAVFQLLEISQRSTQRLTDLSECLLETAKREATKEELGHRPLNIGGLVENAVECSWAMARGSNVDLQIQVPPNLPAPQGDPAQLQRVLDNLLENAISYTPSGGQILIAALPVNGEVQVSVTDTGPGIPSEQRHRIFERFVRLPGARSRRDGLGLGLYFCRQVVQAHGGRIWVEPGPENVGSRFVFTLPVEQAQEPANA
ncbi:MAG: ATP-binding protein [Anaerolineae bacterium]|jgi:signal transduction histidine kinase|nr:ATP-binding protein [Anaerolineae bacterium]MDX9832677.1 ATP-binding protein [Anaerolineae bacterium]